MKIKIGFVTNSSSTTFIVAFPKKIETIDDLEPFIDKRYSEYIFKDTKNTLQAEAKDSFEIISNEFSLTMDEYDNITKEFCESENITKELIYKQHVWRQIFWAHECIMHKRIKDKRAKEFLERIPDDSYIYIFNFEDYLDGIEAELERGNIFKKLPHIRISKH